MPILYLQATTSTGNGAGTLTPSLSSSTQDGSTIIVFSYTGNASETTSSVTDSQGNTYRQITGAAATNTFGMTVWYATNIIGSGTGTCTITITYSGSGQDKAVMIREYPGLNPFGVDKAKSATGTASAALNSGATPAIAKVQELVIGLGVINNTTGSPTAGSGYGNLLSMSTSGGTAKLMFEDLTTTSGGPQTATMNSGISGNWACACVTFQLRSPSFTLRPSRPRPFAPGIAR